MKAIQKTNVSRPARFGRPTPQKNRLIKGSPDQSASGTEFLFESVWDHSLDGMRITDDQGVIVRVNKAYCRLVGMTEEELVGRPFIVVYKEQALQNEALEKYKNRFRTRGVDQFLQRGVLFATGKKAYVETTNAYVTSDNGTPLLLSIFRNVTDRVEAEQAVHASEEKYRDVFQTSRDVIFLLTRDGYVSSINPAVALKTGLPESEWLGKHFSEMVHRDDLEIAWSSFRKAVRKSTAASCELRVLSRSGEYLVGEFTCVPTYRNGRITGILGTVRDVTERKAIELALQRSEKQYHDLFSNAVQGIFQSTPTGKLLAANAALLNILGYESVEELASIDLGATVYVNPEDRKRLAQMLNEKGASSNMELQLRRKDGAIITVLEHSRAVKDAAGNVVSFEGIIEDISERKALEATVAEYLEALKTSRESLEQLNAQKDKLFSVLSHDLRSPFSSILGFCTILLSEEEQVSPEERKEFLGYIKDSAQQQLSLVNKLLDWSRLESGRIKMEIREVDLHEVAQSSMSALLGIAHQRDILLFSNIPMNTMVQGDEQMLGQVFNNLIGNALKFTPPKGVIALELLDAAGEQWKVAVRDTGAGIPKSDLQKLFKVEEKYTRPGLNGELGTGLGLPVVKEMMDKHSGTIEVESVVGEGTTFILHFPKFTVKSGLNVMIVDDEKGIRAIHGRYVRSVLPSAHVLYASNGREAVAVAKKYRPDIIISDYAMKEGDGYELLCSLKKDPSTKGIPVVVITGEDSLASREALLMSGASDVLSKPVLLDGFRQLLSPLVRIPGGGGEAQPAQKEIQHPVPV